MFTVHDLAKRYQVTSRCILDWRKSGHLPAPLTLGKRTVRWRHRDIELHDDYLLKQVECLSKGLDPNQVDRPDYSMPIANDPHQLQREVDAAATDSPSTMRSLVEEIEDDFVKLTAEAAMLASQSSPGQLTEASVQRLRNYLPKDAKMLLLENLPEHNAARLKEILA